MSANRGGGWASGAAVHCCVACELQTAAFPASLPACVSHAPWHKVACAAASYALRYSTLAALHSRARLLCRSLPAPQQPFSAAVAPGAMQQPQRVAFSPDLGVSPVCQEVAALCRWVGFRAGACMQLHAFHDSWCHSTALCALSASYLHTTSLTERGSAPTWEPAFC